MRRPWIKIEVATPDKPEICAIASRLRMDEDMVVGKLVRFWAWVAQNQVYGSNLGVTLEFIDRLVGRKGFGAALCQAGWLIDADGIVSIPNFDRHNSNLARTRALTKTRVERHRKVSAKKVEPEASIVSGEEEAAPVSLGKEDEAPVEDSLESLPADPEPQAPAEPSSGDAAASDDTPETASDEGSEEAVEERNDELSINAMPTFNALQSESVVEKVMDAEPLKPEPDRPLAVEVAEPVVAAKSRKKDDLFEEQPMLF